MRRPSLLSVVPGKRTTALSICWLLEDGFGCELGGTLGKLFYLKAALFGFSSYISWSDGAFSPKPGIFADYGRGAQEQQQLRAALPALGRTRYSTAGSSALSYCSTETLGEGKNERRLREIYILMDSTINKRMSLRGPAPLTVVQLPGEQVQVQGVIQTAQSSSVIHSPQVQTVQVSSLSESEDSQDSSDSIGSTQKARGILARRPSYRKILKDLSSEDTRDRKGDEESPGVSTVTSMSVPTPIYQTSTGQYIAIAANGLQLASASADGVQGLQTLTMTNAGGTQPGTTILQYAQTSDGQQILVPSNQVVVQTASGDMQTYQIRTTPTTTSLPQTVVMTSPVTLTSQSSKTDDPQLKREIRLMKNREAARECRRKKKEYVKCLENRVAVLENQNKTLIEELKTLKDLYCHKSV